MARIRTIKPEFWPDEKLGPLAPIHRLVFLGLISHADDGGRLVDSVRLLDGLIFTLTDDSCAESLVLLSELGVIERGTTASGQPIIEIVGWSKHQKVDKPSNRGALPPIARSNRKRRSSTARADSAGGDTPEPLANPSGESRESVASGSRYEVDLGSGPWTLDQDQEGDRDLRASGSEPRDQPAGQVAAHEPNGTGPFLADFPDTAELVGRLKHDGGVKATAATIEHRFLFPDHEAGLADPVVKGLTLDERHRLVNVALLEYATQPEAWNRPHFTGFVRRLRDQEAYKAPSPTGIVRTYEPPPELGPPADPAVRAAGRELVRLATVGMKSPPPLGSPVIEDPAVIARREQNKAAAQRQLEQSRNGAAS